MIESGCIRDSVEEESSNSIAHLGGLGGRGQAGSYPHTQAAEGPVEKMERSREAENDTQ